MFPFEKFSASLRKDQRTAGSITPVVAYASGADLLKKGDNGLHSLEFYAKCMFGGVLACGVTHASVVTLDVAKVRTQAYSKAGNWPNGLVASISKTYTGEGVKGLTKGLVPTLWGYGAQGLFKFGLNEFFKDYYTHIVGEESLDKTWKKLVLWALSSGSAEIFADVALCPFEMTKVRMQVEIPSIKSSNPIPESLVPAMSAMYRLRTETKFPFGSLVPLWGRQVPYTMIKFVGFYQTQDMVYQFLENKYGKKKSDWNEAIQLSITFGCGYWAGIFCAIATQPMDNLVSMKGIEENKNKSWAQMSREMGAVNLFTKGLGTRIIMIGTLTGLQWWIYGTWKNFCGLGTS